MPEGNPQIVTGMRQPHDTGQVAKPVNQIELIDPIRRRQLSPGEVEFHSNARAYRVEFQKPKAAMNQATGEIIEEGPRNLQFKGRVCITSDPTLIHQAKGCVNIPGAMEPHQHTGLCQKNCKITRCILGHQNPKNPSQHYYPRHPSYGLNLDFCDAAEIDAEVAKSSKAATIQNFKNLAANIPQEELQGILEATGIESFQLPKREMPKEVTK